MNILQTFIWHINHMWLTIIISNSIKNKSFFPWMDTSQRLSISPLLINIVLDILGVAKKFYVWDPINNISANYNAKTYIYIYLRNIHIYLFVCLSNFPYPFPSLPYSLQLIAISSDQWTSSQVLFPLVICCSTLMIFFLYSTYKRDHSVSVTLLAEFTHNDKL